MTIGVMCGIGALCLIALIGSRVPKRDKRLPIVEEVVQVQENNISKAVEKVGEVPVVEEEMEPKQPMLFKWTTIVRVAGWFILVGIFVLGVQWKIKKEMSLFRGMHIIPSNGDKETSQSDPCPESDENGYEMGAISVADDDDNASLLNELNSANIDTSRNGQNTATVEELLKSARDGDLEGLKVALETIDINATDLGGQTALIAAAKASKENCVTHLLQQGANIELKDENDHTAMYFTYQHEDKKCYIY